MVQCYNHTIMDKVYFLKNFSKLGPATEKLLKGFYPKNSEIVVKIHFGESGNKAAFNPQDILPIVKVLKENQLSPLLIDSPVMYPSLRNSIKGYTTVVKMKGFPKIAQCLISNQGSKIKTKDFIAEAIRELVEAKNVLVISHVKGHPGSGFGGAIKNLGMGGVTKGTKKIEHTLCKPKMVKDCKGCGTCVEVCSERAIKIINGKAEFDSTKCIGCAACISNCPNKCLVPEKVSFDDLLAQAASAVINHLPKNTFYINFIWRVVKNCDCFPWSGKKISPDIGLLFSQNPVAIDLASLDLVNKVNGKNLFKEVSGINPFDHINFAEKYTNWAKEYELVEI